MNNDHQLSLSLYLQHYNRVPASQCYDAHLQDISLEYLTLTCRAGRYVIPFKPPMKTYLEARERTVEMHHASLSALGKSDIVMDEYLLPNSVLGILTPVLCTWAVYFLSIPSHLQPGGSWFHDRLLQPYFPAPLTSLIKSYPMAILLAIVAIHVAETAYFIRARLPKFNVRPGSRVWWLWVATVFLSGWPAVMRFDKEIKEREDKKGKGKPTH